MCCNCVTPGQLCSAERRIQFFSNAIVHSRNWLLPLHEMVGARGCVTRVSLPCGDIARMSTVIWFAALFCGVATLLHIATALIAAGRCRPAPPLDVRPDAPAVTIVRPVCGIDNHVEATLRSTFELDYPNYEILFCVASARDPVVPLVEWLIATSGKRARLLIGDDRISANPKLNNVVKGWHAAAHDWIIIADSNVLMPADYIQRLIAAWRRDTGLVCAPPVGCRPRGFWAELECAFLNTYQARWQYFADTIGAGFAQGKTMLWRREILQAAGGIEALALELAEDAAATKIVDAQGLRVRLVDAPFGQPLGYRRAAEVWNRQVRWARLRRASFPRYFLPEIIAGGLPPLACCALAAGLADLSVPAAAGVFAVIWYSGEFILARAARWQLSLMSPLAWMLRDLLLPVLWIKAWSGTEFVWRGNAMRIADNGKAA
jgi:ceramide glucosyltransferase